MNDLPPPLVPPPPSSATPAAPVPEKRHSGLGIASFVISLVGGVAILVLFVLAGVLVRRGSPTNYPGQSLVGAGAILLLGAEFVAAALGIAALFQADRKRVFAVLGTVFSVLTLLGTGALIVIGIVAATSH